MRGKRRRSTPKKTTQHAVSAETYKNAVLEGYVTCLSRSVVQCARPVERLPRGTEAREVRLDALDVPRPAPLVRVKIEQAP